MWRLRQQQRETTPPVNRMLGPSYRREQPEGNLAFAFSTTAIVDICTHGASRSADCAKPTKPAPPGRPERILNRLARVPSIMEHPDSGVRRVTSDRSTWSDAPRYLIRFPPYPSQHMLLMLPHLTDYGTALRWSAVPCVVPTPRLERPHRCDISLSPSRCPSPVPQTCRPGRSPSALRRSHRSISPSSGLWNRNGGPNLAT